VAIKPIEILINAKDNASSVFSGLQGKVAAVGAAIATYFGVNAFAGMVKGAADFEQGMSRVQAATGASGAEMEKLRKAAEDAGANTKFTSTEAAGALENLAKAGLNANEAIATLPAVLQLAQAGDIELATASEFLTKAVMGMGLAFEDAGRVADVLALGANATNTSVTGLAQALSYAAPVANSLGLSLESTVAIIGKFADAGIDASRAGTALNSILSQFADPASKFRNELAAAGIITGDFEQALKQLAAAGPGGSQAINSVGTEAGPALRALLNQGIGSLTELTAKLRDAEGSAAATAKVMQDNLNGSFNGLASAWDAVKNTLATPVLPVLKDGVDQLAAAFKSAVADGSVGRFGEAIATAFKTGIQFIRDFIGTVDFTATLQRLQEFADGANQTLTKVGEYATNAGNTVKLAYGVMSAGVNAVLTAIYGIGSVFAEVASSIMLGVAKLRDGLASVTFGGLSADFRLAAEDARNAAQGFGDAAQAMRDKATQALQGTEAAAQLARDGFTGLAGATNDSKEATESWASTVAAANLELQKSAEFAEAAARAGERKAQADAAARQSADEHRAAIAQLRKEYQDLVASGNLQGAAEKLIEVEKALKGVGAAAGNSGREAAQAAEQIKAAFARMGIESSAKLKETANNFKRDYEIIKNAGTSTAQDIGAAFQAAAEKAIAANNGIAPAWVQAEAGVRGYEIQVDAAGKATLKLRDNIDAVGSTSGRVAQGMQREWGGVAGSINDASKALQDYQRRMQQTYGRPGEGDKGLFERGRMSSRGEELGPGVEEIGSGGNQFRNRDGMTSDARGRTQTMGAWTRTAIIDYLTSSGLDEQVAIALSKQFLDSSGNVPYNASDVQKRWAGRYGSLSDALAKMAEYYKFDDRGQMEAAQLAEFERTRRNSPQLGGPQPGQQGGMGGGNSSGGSSNSGRSGISGVSAPTNVTIRIGGVNNTLTTDAAGARTLEQVLRALTDGKSVS
jgi:TP901 family phage tail tape measure protein